MTAKRTPSAEPAPRVRGRDRAKRDRFSGARWAAVGGFALLVLSLVLLLPTSCGSSHGGWTKVRSYSGVRVNLGDPPSPPMTLRAGAVRVTGTVTYDTAREKYFVLFLTPRHPTGPGRVYSFRLVSSATDDVRTEGFAGSVKRVDAGEYWLTMMSGSATCDVTVYQKGGH